MSSETTIRARVKTVLETVANIGIVHDRERYAADWTALTALFKQTISSVDQIRGWTISLLEVSENVENFQGSGFGDTFKYNYTYRLQGLMTLNDTEPEKNLTEKDFAILVLAVVEALNTDSTLNASRESGPIVASVRTEPRMFAGILCHYCDARLMFEEDL